MDRSIMQWSRGILESNARCFKTDVPASAKPELQHFKMVILCRLKWIHWRLMRCRTSEEIDSPVLCKRKFFIMRISFKKHLSFQLTIYVAEMVNVLFIYYIASNKETFCFIFWKNKYFECSVKHNIYKKLDYSPPITFEKYSLITILYWENHL